MFKLAINLARLTERMTSELFRLHDIYSLEELVIEYLDSRKKLFSEFPSELGRCRPKHHYLSHYPSAIRLYGPPTSYWTARYEAKHRIAKSIAESSKNFINITYTISLRTQRRACSIFYHGMFLTAEFQVPINVRCKKELGNSEIDLRLGQLMDSHDFASNELEYKCRKYEAGDVLVLKRVDKISIDAGIISAFVIRNDRAYVLVRQCALRETKFGFFESTGDDTSLRLVDMRSLQDSYPLLMRGTESSFLCLLHHHVSFDYD